MWNYVLKTKVCCVGDIVSVVIWKEKQKVRCGWHGIMTQENKSNFMAEAKIVYFCFVCVQVLSAAGSGQKAVFFAQK